MFPRSRELHRLLARVIFLTGLLLLLAVRFPAAEAQYLSQHVNYTNITTQTTTTPKNAPGILHTVCINTPAATGTITIFDGPAASGVKIATITAFASTNPCFEYHVNFNTSLVIVTATASNDVTVTWE
jgi:hypothetical protein